MENRLVYAEKLAFFRVGYHLPDRARATYALVANSAVKQMHRYSVSGAYGTAVGLDAVGQFTTATYPKTKKRVEG